MRDIINGKRCGKKGYWITSKGEEVNIEEMNFFQLGATVRKIEKHTQELYKNIEDSGIYFEDTVKQKLQYNKKYWELKRVFDKQNYFNRKR